MFYNKRLGIINFNCTRIIWNLELWKSYHFIPIFWSLFQLLTKKTQSIGSPGTHQKIMSNKDDNHRATSRALLDPIRYFPLHLLPAIKEYRRLILLLVIVKLSFHPAILIKTQYHTQMFDFEDFYFIFIWMLSAFSPNISSYSMLYLFSVSLSNLLIILQWVVGSCWCWACCKESE